MFIRRRRGLLHGDVWSDAEAEGVAYECASRAVGCEELPFGAGGLDEVGVSFPQKKV
ncbi:MAG: hypothetical protein NC204_01005 [Candidatus Amulumruptor caecigallinarius]|nr:hypothetical protein [Candidatus Amulumruptor caecigallinarius]